MTNVTKERKLARLRGNLDRQNLAIQETESEIAEVKRNPDRPRYASVLMKLTTKLARQTENRDDTIALIEAFEYPTKDPAQADLLDHQEPTDEPEGAQTSEADPREPRQAPTPRRRR